MKDYVPKWVVQHIWSCLTREPMWLYVRRSNGWYFEVVNKCPRWGQFEAVGVFTNAISLADLAGEIQQAAMDLQARLPA